MNTEVWRSWWHAMASHVSQTFRITAEYVVCDLSKFARMKSCFPEGNCASSICGRWKKESIEIPPRFHQEFLDCVRSALQVCAGGLPNATALRQSVRKVYPGDTNTRSSGFSEVGAIWLSGLDRCHRLRNLGLFWKWFSWSRGKPGGEKSV